MLSHFLSFRSLSIFLLIFSLTSCKKDSGNLQQEIDKLNARLTGIESQISSINTSLNTLEKQGKLNSDELTSLKALFTNLTTVTNDLKNSNNVNSSDIVSLKASIELAISKIQFEDLKNTVSQLNTLVEKNFADQQITEQSTNELQKAISKIATDLETLMTGQSVQILTGRIEKGGFTKGSLVSIYEMDSVFTQTGRSFSSSITDNYGSFNLKVQNLKGKVAKVIATGFYYNEVTGKNSNSQISLKGAVKIDSSAAINVNVLTELEEPRVEYLVSQGKSFNESKTQAVTEVLNLFGIHNSGITRAEKVNLIGSSSQSNILLSLATILVGFRTDSELLEILNDIGKDLETDGQLNNISLGNDLMTHLYYLDTTTVIQQVRTKYATQFPDSVLNKINLNYLNEFKKTTSFTKSYNLIEYPSESLTSYNGVNILDPSIAQLKSSLFEVSANLKANSLKLRIEISSESGNLSALLGTNKNWKITYISATKAMLETVTAGINTVTFTAGTTAKQSLTIKFFENGNTVPTKTQIVNISI